MRCAPILLLAAGLAVFGCDEESPSGPEYAYDERSGEEDHNGGSEEGEYSARVGVNETATAAYHGVELVLRYDGASQRFTGTVRNTAARTARRVYVEIYLSNGVELESRPPADLAPGATREVELGARGQSFTWFRAEIETDDDD